MNRKTAMIWIIFTLASFPLFTEGYINSGVSSAPDTSSLKAWYMTGWEGYFPIDESFTLLIETIHQGIYSFDTNSFGTQTECSTDISYRQDSLFARIDLIPQLITLENFSDYIFNLTLSALLSMGGDDFTIELLPEGTRFFNDSRINWEAGGRVTGRFSAGESWLLSPFLGGGGDFLITEGIEPFYSAGLEWDWYPGSRFSQEGTIAFKQQFSGAPEWVQTEEELIEVNGYYGFREIRSDLKLLFLISDPISLELTLPVSYRTSDVTEILSGENLQLWQFALMPDLSCHLLLPKNFSLSLTPGYRLLLSNDRLYDMNHFYMEINLDYIF